MRLGQHLTEEQRAHQSSVHMGQPSGNKGRRMTDEQKAKLSAAMKGRTAWNKGISCPRVGVKQSFATRAKISAARIGFKASAETKAKMSAARCNPSPEYRARLSASSFQRGKCGPLSPHWKGGAPISGRKHTAIRRTLGFVPLNSWFPGCEAHHINHNDVIYLPRQLHHSIYHCQRTGKGMVEMNALAGQFLTEDWT